MEDDIFSSASNDDLPPEKKSDSEIVEDNLKNLNDEIDSHDNDDDHDDGEIVWVWVWVHYNVYLVEFDARYRLAVFIFVVFW